MKKKLLATCLIIALAATAVIGGTLAYFTDTDTADNVFTVGNVSIDLTEPNWEGEGSEDAPEAYPGEALKKDPTVTNDGKNPAFVRIKVEGWDCLGEGNEITFRTDYVAGKLGTDWVEYNGYYYYTKVLEIGATTDALFDQIVIPTTVTNGSADINYKLTVTAEAVQAQGAKASWADVQKMTVTEIDTWFTTVMAAEAPTP